MFDNKFPMSDGNILTSNVFSFESNKKSVESNINLFGSNKRWKESNKRVSEHRAQHLTPHRRGWKKLGNCGEKFDFFEHQQTEMQMINFKFLNFKFRLFFYDNE